MSCSFFAIFIWQSYAISFFPPPIQHLNATYKGQVNEGGLLIPVDGYFQYLVLSTNPGSSDSHSITNLQVEGQPIVAEEFTFVFPNGSWSIYYIVSGIIDCGHVLLEPSNPDYPQCPEWQQSTGGCASGSGVWKLSCSLQWPIANSVLQFSECITNNEVQTVSITILTNGTNSGEADLLAADAGASPPSNAFNLPSACNQQSANLLSMSAFKQAVHKKYGKLAANIIARAAFALG